MTSRRRVLPIGFFHVRKAGGTGVRHAIPDARAKRRHVQIENDDTWETMPDAQIASYDVLAGHLGWRFTARVPGGIGITCLHDPLERTQSVYFFMGKL